MQCNKHHGICHNFQDIFSYSISLKLFYVCHILDREIGRWNSESKINQVSAEFQVKVSTGWTRVMARHIVLPTNTVLGHLQITALVVTVNK